MSALLDTMLMPVPVVRELRSLISRPARKITLSPEFPGAVLTGSGGSNTGTMTSDFCSENRAINAATTPTAASPCDSDTDGEEHNYYSWTAQATNNYDIWVKWQIPSDFAALATTNPISFYGWRTSASDTVGLTIYDDAGTTCGLGTVIDTNIIWDQENYNDSGGSGCSIFTADEYILFHIALTVGVNDEHAKMGEIEFNYLSKF